MTGDRLEVVEMGADGRQLDGRELPSEGGEPRGVA